MSTIKLILLFLCLMVSSLNPFLPLLLSTNSTEEEIGVVEEIEQPIIEEIEVGYNINSLLTTELDGYCTIDVPQSHWQIASSSDLNTSTQKYFKYKDNRTRLLMGYVTNIKDETDIPGYIVQKLAKVDMVTNTKTEVEYSNGTWMVIPSAEPIDEMNVVVYYKLSKDNTSAFWMRVTKDLEINEDEFNEVINMMIDTYNMYYMGNSIFDTPTTGIYEGTSDNELTNPDEYKENDDNNTVFQGRGGFVADADISNDWRDLEVIIDGTKFHVPDTLSSFLNAGFEIYEGNKTADTEVSVLSDTTFKVKNNLGTVVTLTVLNESADVVKPLSECSVVRIKIDTDYFVSTADEENSEINLKTHELILACGATWDVYTDDLKDKFGACTSTKYDSKRLNLVFKDSNRYTYIRIGNLKGIEAVTLSVID